jgi:formylglycine-generating enzyme required for sulfatase activity
MLKSTLLMVVTISCYSVGKTQSVYINMGKGWTYITGAQRAVNDSHRVNYLIGSQKPFGLRVNNFRDMEPYYKHDSEFLNAHLSPSEVFESNKMLDGSSFFISKTEVSNVEYRKFVEFCIAQWMKQNRPEIVAKYKWESPEYVQAVQAWLESSSSTSAASGAVTTATVLAPATQWGELYMRKLDWDKITYNGSSIFPNTQVWISDFMMGYNEPMRDYYFVHPAYNNYPVVGVSHWQATLYCRWYSAEFGVKEKEQYNIVYRLPMESEWERAASVVAEKRSKKSSGSPVYNAYMRNSKGAYIANFRPLEDNFIADGGMYPTPVQSYWPNDAGCYNMQGNVAEWTSTVVVNRVGEEIQDAFIIKGGAWTLPEAACTVGARGILYYGVDGQAPAASYVGFRMVAVPTRKFRPLITPEF